ncbi:hypothetical protein L7F22_034667 [Adiantum nelumboides]|nr:hypothetical protein [Adiantum nelumboides]
MDRTEEEKKQTNSDKPKPVEIDLQIPLMQLEEPTHEDAFEEVKNFDYTKIILTLSRQFKCQQVVAKETNFQKERADRAYEEITNLKTALELVTQERDTNARDNENLLRDLIDLQSQLIKKEAQNHEFIKNEKKMKEQLKYKDARFQKLTASYNTVKTTLTALVQNQEPASTMPSTSDSAIANTLAALQEELQTKKLQRQLLVFGFMSQIAQHEAKVKQLELELAQAKADLELQRQQSEVLSKGKEEVGSLASTSQIHQAETHLHIQLPLMPEMPEFPSTQEREQQRPAPGALDVREGGNSVGFFPYVDTGKKRYFNVAEETTTYGVWQKLCSMYEKQSAASQIYWLKKLVELRMKEGTAMSNHLNEFHIIFSQLTAQEIVFPDSVKAMFLLITLPDSWDTFRTALSNSVVPEGLTSANVEGSLLIEEVNRKNTDKGKGNSALVVRGRQQLKEKKGKKAQNRSRSRDSKSKDHIECYHCGKKCHMKRDYTQWKHEKGKAKRSEQDDKKKSLVKIEEVNVTGSGSDSDSRIAAGLFMSMLCKLDHIATQAPKFFSLLKQGSLQVLFQSSKQDGGDKLECNDKCSQDGYEPLI